MDPLPSTPYSKAIRDLKRTITRDIPSVRWENVVMKGIGGVFANAVAFV